MEKQNIAQSPSTQAPRGKEVKISFGREEFDTINAVCLIGGLGSVEDFIREAALERVKEIRAKMSQVLSTNGNSSGKK